MTATTATTFDFSPYACHRLLMDKSKRELAYRGGDVRAWQRKLRRQVKLLLGMDKLPRTKRGLNVRSVWKRDHEAGTIERIVFTSEPGSDVPAYVCIPKDAAPPYRWMICVQGHSTGMHNSIGVAFDDETKPITVESDRDFGVQCMRRGVAALCIEQRAFGERSDTKEHTPNCQAPAMHALMLGRTLIGERVFDVDRGIDYLATRRDVRPGGVGIMGNSGGGTISTFAAAVLPRIRFAMPSCYFCTFRDSILAMHHCMCNYVPGLFRIAEMSDVLGLFAPKPVVVVAGEKDDIFPIVATQSSFRKLKQIYKAAGAEKHCHLVVGPEGHRFYSELAWPTALKEFPA